MTITANVLLPLLITAALGYWRCRADWSQVISWHIYNGFAAVLSVAAWLLWMVWK
jgi:hypothetical protein